MDKRQLRGKVQTRDLGSGPGDAVDVYLPESRRRLRFQLSTVDYRAWRGAADELGADVDDVDWIFASDGPITQQILGRRGYCLRVRCETVGGERRVHIGAEARDRTVAWTPLEDCALTPAQRPAKRRAVAIASMPQVRAAVVDPAELRRVRGLVAQLKSAMPGLGKVARKPVTRALSRAEAWLAHQEGAELPAQQRRKLANQTPDFVAERLKHAISAAQNDLAMAQWLERKETEQRRSTERTPLKQPAWQQPKGPVEDPVERLTRQLIAVAAQGRTIPAILLDAGRARPDLQQRMEALDRHIPHDVPVLSALAVGADGGPVPFFRDILKAAGLAVPRTDEALVKIWHREQERAHAAYANPPKELPPRLAPQAG